MNTRLPTTSSGKHVPPEGRPAAFRGFTLIECIGVIAVVAFLVGMLVPTIIRRVDQSARTQDGADVDAMVEALRQYVLQNKVVPSNLTNAIKANMTLPANLIMRTRRGTLRSFLIDPSISLGGGLPYTQGTGGTGKPANARIMILSCLESNSPSGAFSTLWNTPDNDALRIRRLNLESMFHQLMLVNRDTLPPQFSVDGSSNYDVVRSATGTNAYYLDGSVVGLYATNSSLITRHLLNSSISFVFESGAWHAQVVGKADPAGSSGGGGISQAFADTAAAFFATNWNFNTEQSGGKGGSQSAVLSGMYNFMSTYTLWANQTPNFNHFGLNPGGNGSSELPIWEMLREGKLDVDHYSGNDVDGLLHQ
jgi:type II secretory pathway pseudopilin PulG